MATCDVPLVAALNVGGIAGALVLASHRKAGDGDGYTIFDKDIVLELAGAVALVVDGKHNGVSARKIPVVGGILLVAVGAVAEIPRPRDNGAKVDGADVEKRNLLVNAEHMVFGRRYGELGPWGRHDFDAEVGGVVGIGQILGDAECAAAVLTPGDIDRGACGGTYDGTPGDTPLIGGAWVGIDGIALGGELAHLETWTRVLGSDALLGFFELAGQTRVIDDDGVGVVGNLRPQRRR